MALSDVLLRGAKRISGARGSLFGLAVVGLGLALSGTAYSQDRRIVTIEDADFFGSDYRTVKDVDLDGCKAVCLADNQCRAFTFNTSAGWCFLKSDFGQLQSFRGAIAGRVVEVAQPRQTAEADRKAELSFIDKDLIEGAATYSKRIEQDAKPRGQTAENLRQAGQTALNAKNGVQAEQDFSGVIALLPDDYSNFARLHNCTTHYCLLRSQTNKL